MKMRQTMAMEPTDDPRLSELYTAAEAMGVIGVKKGGLNYLLHNGNIKGVRTGDRWLFYKDSVDEYANERNR